MSCTACLPVIAAVNGLALGAGVGLARSADVVWASESSTFGPRTWASACPPDGGTTFLCPASSAPAAPPSCS
ncbi:MAG: hypothetical protein IPN01_15115 [Deltaproteobacteria bacterium]|nr:hypothetical protein [Deltaproteobacteria bacterium]